MIIRTSDAQWLTTLAQVYRERQEAVLLDDAKLGVDPTSQTLLQMGRKGRLSREEWVAVGLSVGLSSAGIFLVVFAAVDPEPWSKVGFAIGAGSVLALTGGFSAIRILTRVKPPRISVGKSGFEISWD